VPLQPPDAVQDVAFVEVHVKVLLPPLLTVVGAADNVTVGTGVELVTETEAVAWPEPPAPAQLSVNEALAFNAPVLALPEIAFVPLQPPDAVHDVAFVEVQVKVLLPPLATVVGDADSVTVGRGVELVTATEVLARAVPPEPLQVIVNVVPVVNAPVLSLPESSFPPLQPPDAVHDVARVLDQVNLVVPPELTELGLAESVAVGARL
jgi:hypothetical protein